MNRHRHARRLWWAAICLLLVGGACVWFGSAWYFAGLITAGHTGGYSEAKEARRLLRYGIDIPVGTQVRIQTRDVTVAGSYYVHPRPRGCAVIVLPGIGGDRTSIVRVLPLFRDMGCHILALDHRGTGASSAALRTFGYHEKHDVAAAITWLSGTTGLATRHIGLWGVSFGAAVALQTVRLDPHIAFVIADSSYADLASIARDAARREYGAWLAPLVPTILWVVERRTGLRTADVAPVEAVRGGATPLLLIHARDDPETPVEHTLRIYAASNQTVTLLQVTDWGAAHGQSIVADHAAYQHSVRRFIERYAPRFFAMPDRAGFASETLTGSHHLSTVPVSSGHAQI